MENKSPLLQIKEFLLDLLFPRHCVSCQREGSFLCQGCFEKIILIKSATCPFCNRLSPWGKFCSRCRRKYKPALSGILVASYFEGPLKEAIHSYKYDGLAELSRPLSEILIKYLLGNLPNPVPILIPVPLHPKRERQRGFNQATLLAEAVGGELSLPVLKNKLQRSKNTLPQINLSRKKRRENVQGAFIYQGKDLVGETILLVDDVCTTGATLNECAKELKKAQAKEVWGLVLAKD